MTKKITGIRDAILLAMLPGVAFDGWSWEGARQAADQAGYGADMADAVFPGGLKGILCHFSDYADRQMMLALSPVDPLALRVRERVRQAVEARFEALMPHKEAVRMAAAYWIGPLRKWESVRLVWRTADHIWDWAGDTATDYNRYTKRGLLSGILAGATLVWMNDKNPGLTGVMAFVDRRIENVMQFEKIKGKIIRKTG